MDEYRPGFQDMLRALKAKDRGWTVIVAFDTSRIGRRRYVAQLLAREMEKSGVSILFVKVPEVDPISSVILESVFQAMDEVHSLMSREKGLAGMAENVRQGFRAGGRAPLGYRLASIPTGTVRDGAPVTKSRLEPHNAESVARYLRARAAGVPRSQASLELPVTTLIGIEWNALTYAGHTVWNVHAERVKGGYKGGAKRRPREEWVIAKDTHPALITEREALRILDGLEAKRKTRARVTRRTYLLAGLLVAPDGAAWHGDSGCYRLGKGRKVDADRLERAVVERLAEDLQDEGVVREVTERIRRQYAAEVDPAEGKKLARQVADLTRRIERVGLLLAETSAPQALLRQIEGWEAERAGLASRMASLEAAAAVARAAREVKESDVRRMLRTLATSIEDREHLKLAIGRLIGSVTLNPQTFACTIHYSIPTESGDKVASPRGSALIPRLEFARRVMLAPNRSWRRAA